MHNIQVHLEGNLVRPDEPLLKLSGNRLDVRSFGHAVRQSVEEASGKVGHAHMPSHRSLMKHYDEAATKFVQQTLSRSLNVDVNFLMIDTMWDGVIDMHLEEDGEPQIFKIVHVQSKHFLWKGKYLPKFHDLAQAWLLGELYLEKVGDRPETFLLYISDEGHCLWEVNQNPDHVHAVGSMVHHRWSKEQSDFAIDETGLERIYRGRLDKLRGLYEMNLRLALNEQNLRIRGEQEVPEFEYAEWYIRQD